MVNRIWAAALTLVAPALALAQSRPNDQPVTVAGPEIGRWILAIVVIAAIAFAFWAFRTVRRRGPPGSQAPTPRGP